MYPYHGTGGLTFANRDAAINFKYDPGHEALDLGIFAARSYRGAEILIRRGDDLLHRERLDLLPDRPIRRRIKAGRSVQKSSIAPTLILTQGKQTLIGTEAKPAMPVQWGFPHLPPGGQ